jgi:putative salt-induced outer membrane protein YdiY
MKFVKGVVVGALCAVPFVGLAEEAADATAEEPAVKWEKNLSAGVTYRDGNTKKSLYTLNIKADRFGEHNDILSSLYAEYGESAVPTAADPDPESERTEGQVRGTSEYRHKFGESRFFAGGFVEGLNDSIKQIRFRGKVGPMVGYYLLDNDKHKLDISFGINYVYERTAVDERTFGEYRAAGNYLWSISEHSSYYLNVEYTANMDNVDVDNYGLLVTGIRSKINSTLALFIEFRDEYDNRPDAGVLEHNDITVTGGLSYDF